MKKYFLILCLLISLFIPTTEIFSQEVYKINFDLKEQNLPFGFTKKVSTNLPSIGLALSGGGSRGIAHIGVIKALKESNIPIDYIVGTSMGSIIGGLYAAGYDLETLTEIFTQNDWESFYNSDESDRNELFVDQKITEDRSLFTLRMDGFDFIIPTSINSGQKVHNFLNLLVLNAPLNNFSNFDELRCKFRAVSSDLVTGNEVIHDRGSLSLAMRASSSVSFLLAPVKKDSMILMDGGLVANIPVKITKSLGSDFVIASNVTSPLKKVGDLDVPWTIADQVVSIPMNIINKENLAEADVLIEPELNDLYNYDFSKIDSIIEIGYKEANKRIGSIVSVYKSYCTANKNYHEILPEVFSKNKTEPELNVIRNLSGGEILFKELKFELYKELNSGRYKEFSAEVSSNGELSINYKLNPAVKDFVIKGISEEKQDTVYSILSSLKNKSFNPDSTVSKLIEILSLYRSEGNSIAQIKNTYFDNEDNLLYMTFNEGIIDEIIIDGNINTDETIIYREIPFVEGEIFDIAKAEQALSNIRSTNLFKEIEIDVLDSKSNGKTVKLSVKEKLSRVFRFGFKIDNEKDLQLSFDMRDENLLGTGTELGLILNGGLRNRNVVFEHKANRIFDSYFTYKVRFFHKFEDYYVYENVETDSEKRFEREKTAEYRQVSNGVSIGLGTQVRKFGNLIVEGSFHKDEIRNKEDFISKSKFFDISSIKFALHIDSQNKYPYPNKGFYVNTFYETAQKFFGGEVSYTKIFFDYKSFFGLWQDHTVIPSARIGFADETLPLSQHFSLGGQNSFFGMREAEQRGRQVFKTSLAYRYKLPFKIFFDTYLKVRYDLGAIWTEKEEIKLKNLTHGIGATVSFDTPVGPADFSIGRSFKPKNTLPKNIISYGPVYMYFTIGFYY